MRKVISALFNVVFHQSRYSDIWSQGIINPFTNWARWANLKIIYRNITLISALGKLFNSLLNDRQRYFKDAFQLDAPWQNGFKQGSRTIDNLFIYNAVIIVKPWNGQNARATLVFCRALLFKLISHGFTRDTHVNNKCTWFWIRI